MHKRAEVYLTPRTKASHFIGSPLIDITGLDVDTSKVEVVTLSGILSITGDREGYLRVSLGKYTTTKVTAKEAHEYMAGRTVKVTDIVGANVHRVTFTDESQVIISSEPDVEDDQRLVYSLVQRVDEEIV